MIYIYLVERPTVHLAEYGDVTLCGINRGSNRLKNLDWQRSPTWKAIKGKKRWLCKSCKRKRTEQS